MSALHPTHSSLTHSSPRLSWKSKMAIVGGIVLLALGIIATLIEIAGTSYLSWRFHSSSSRMLRGVTLVGPLIFCSGLVLATLGFLSCSSSGYMISKSPRFPHPKVVPNSTRRSLPENGFTINEPIQTDRINPESTKSTSSGCLDIDVLSNEATFNLWTQISIRKKISPTSSLVSGHCFFYACYLKEQYSVLSLMLPSQKFPVDRIKKVIYPKTLEQHIYDNLPQTEEARVSGKNLPIFLHVNNNHWTLVYIDQELRTIEYYDSLNLLNTGTVVTNILNSVAAELSKQDREQPPYQVIKKINVTLQQDNYQCGPWVLYFLEHRLKEPSVDFNLLAQENTDTLIAHYRTQLKNHIPAGVRYASREFNFDLSPATQKLLNDY